VSFRGTQLVSLHRPPLAWLVLIALGRGAHAVACHPVFTLLVTGVLVLWLTTSTLVVAGTALACTLALGVWALVDRTSFDRYALPLVLGGWRWAFVYAPRWRYWMSRHGLSRAGTNGRTVYPRLYKVHCTAALDRLLVGIPAGMSPPSFEAVSEALSHATGHRECRIRVERPGRVWIELLRRDPLLTTIPARPYPAADEWQHVVLGTYEDGTNWVVDLIDATHVLVVGETGSGKGSVLGSLLRHLAPAIHAGLVQVWAIDPKGGMDLGRSRALFHRYAGDRPEEAIELLRDAVQAMDERARELARLRHENVAVSTEYPLILLVVDELASLMAYLDSYTLTSEVERYMGLLLTKGRAPGVRVWGAVQSPGRSVVPFRDLFPVKIALRLATPEQVDAVLGDYAVARGAAAHLISTDTPGVGYVAVNGEREPRKVRAARVASADVDDACARYGVVSATGEHDPADESATSDDE